MKHLLSVTYLLLLLAMAAATLLPVTGVSSANAVYGSPWFVALWGVLALTALAVTVQGKWRGRSLSWWGVHSALLLILGGALLTHLTATRGQLHLRQGVWTEAFVLQPKSDREPPVTHPLPFRVRLDSFHVDYHPGTRAPQDYVSHLSVAVGGDTLQQTVSMNSILTLHRIRFYQTSYDDDGRGSLLTLNRDAWGIGLTYAGYLLLFASLIGLLFDPRGHYRRLLRHPLLRKGVMIIALMGTAANTRAATLPDSTMRQWEGLLINHNDRICPFPTYALEVTRKLCGSSTYHGRSALEVVTGCLLGGEEWDRMPLLRVNSRILTERMRLPEEVSLESLFANGYALAPYLEEYVRGNHDAFHRDVARLDEKVMLLLELRKQSALKMFPIRTAKGTLLWWAPTDRLPATVSKDEQAFVRGLFTLMGEELKRGNTSEVHRLTVKLRAYQQSRGAGSLPSPSTLKAERLYNALPWVSLLFMLNLTMGIVTLIISLRRLLRNGTEAMPRWERWAQRISVGVLIAGFATLTFVMGLRWKVSGNIPLNNGYETMLAMAWTCQLIGLVIAKRFRIIITFAFLLSGFFLLVSHFSLMDPAISHRMPVLNSPLLSLHVSVIMIAYALLSLTFVCGMTALIVALISRNPSLRQERMESLALLSRLFLTPAVTTLGIGIFVGAIWANVSWGQYWSWDPKETWALITWMVYATALHPGLVPTLNKPLHYHLFTLIAFATLLMTYFGVNYLLGGMHSYA